MQGLVRAGGPATQSFIPAAQRGFAQRVRAAAGAARPRSFSLCSAPVPADGLRRGRVRNYSIASVPLSQPAAPAAPSSEVLAEARRAVRGFTVCMTANLTRHDRLGQYLFGVSAVVPMMDTVLEAPHRTCHENASVAELRPVLSDGGSPPNTLAHLRSGLYGMHACPGDQTLVVASDGPWFLYCAREPREGERAADVKRYVQIRVPAGQAVVTIPKDRPYGLGTAPGARTIVHGVRRSGTEVAELGSDGIEVIGGRAFTTEELDPPQ